MTESSVIINKEHKFPSGLAWTLYFGPSIEVQVRDYIKVLPRSILPNIGSKLSMHTSILKSKKVASLTAAVLTKPGN